MTALAITLLAACARPAATPAVDLAAEEQAIRAQGEQLLAREQAKDLEGAVAFYTDDAVMLPPGSAAVASTDGVRNLYNDFFTNSGLTSLESTTTDIEVAASGDLAVEHGVNILKFTTPQGEMTDVGKYLAVWKKVDGQWKIARIAVNSDAPPPGASAPGAPPPPAPPTTTRD